MIDVRYWQKKSGFAIVDIGKKKISGFAIVKEKCIITGCHFANLKKCGV